MKKVDTFTIPEEIAKHLTDLMATQAINDRILTSLADQPDKYDNILKSQIQIQRMIDQLKYIITNQYVPEHYRFEQYSWNYNGIDVAGTDVEILVNE